jgi:hypothetical protein
MLNEYGVNRWCIIADADELLFFPNAAFVSLKDLREYFETKGSEALHCMLLDMYSDKPLSTAQMDVGEDPLRVCSFFDLDHERVQEQIFNPRDNRYYSLEQLYGGCRLRMFGLRCNISKISFFKYTPQVFLGPGRHSIDKAKISDMQGVVFHTKFFNDFLAKAFTEAERGEHWTEALEYKGYVAALEKDPDPVFLCDRSRRFIGGDELVRLDIMRTTAEFDLFAKKRMNDREKGNG